MHGPVHPRAFDPMDGVPLSWSAGHPDGVPFRRGENPEMMTRDQLSHASVRIAGVGSEILSVPEQMSRYLEILGWISTGAAALRFEERRPHPDDPTKWTVWICWVELRGHVPTGRQAQAR